MPILKTSMPGLVVFEPQVFQDQRGYFFESYNKQLLKENNIDIEFVQDNQSQSTYGVIRGLHYQLNPYAQTKLLRVLKGKILDVVVDIRKGSPTYAQIFSIELSETNKKQLLIPKGFAHGFSVLSEIAEVFYKCDNVYAKDHEAGIIYNDPALHIDWKIPLTNSILSEKDSRLPLLAKAPNNFKY